ncbi:MAG: hypothetical protein HFI90_08630 [Clostridia bacterium]|nr:hypothetical protein [Clostridia bacterium]
MAEKKFRTAMNGYNRDDVHHYIEEMAVEAEQKLLQKEEYIKKMEHELARMRNENEKYKNEAQQAQQNAQQFQTELEQARTQSNALQNDFAEKLAQTKAQHEEVKAAEADAEKQRLLERIQKLEEERDKIPAALIVAQRQADEIVQNSKSKMQQYEMEMQEKVAVAYRNGIDKLKRLKEQLDSGAAMLGDMENQVRFATSQFVQVMEQSKHDTTELVKVFETGIQENEENSNAGETESES